MFAEAGMLRACKSKIDGSDWMCKRHRSEHQGQFRPVTLLRKAIPLLAAARSGSSLPVTSNSQWLRNRGWRLLRHEYINFPNLGNFTMVVGFNPPNNRRDNDHVEETYCDSICDVRIRLCICCAVECGHRSSGTLPCSRAHLQLRAATASAATPDLLCSSGGWRRRPTGFWLLRAAVWISPRPPILRSTRLLA